MGRRGFSCVCGCLFLAVASLVALGTATDPRVPDEVRWKSGYVNPQPPPGDFRAILLWGIAIADTRVPGYQSATIEISRTQLTCRIDGKDVVISNDSGAVHGGLYIRHPWFGGSDEHEVMPVADGPADHAVVLPVGQRPDRVWHFWSASSRAELPPGKPEGCTVRARVKISPGALLQVGMDYWRSTTAVWAGSGVNNHEAGVSDWYFPGPDWQEAVFTDTRP